MVRGVPSNRPTSVAIRGMLEPFILSRAKNAPTSGKGVSDALSRVTNARWKPSPGTLYPVLAKLERKGLLKAAISTSPRKQRGRREIEYTITAKGKSRLEEERVRMSDEMKRVQRIFVPVMGVIMHEMQEEEAILFADAMEFQHNLRERLLSLPVPKRRDALARLKPALEQADILGKMGIKGND